MCKNEQVITGLWTILLLSVGPCLLHVLISFNRLHLLKFINIVPGGLLAENNPVFELIVAFTLQAPAVGAPMGSTIKPRTHIPILHVLVSIICFTNTTWFVVLVQLSLVGEA